MSSDILNNILNKAKPPEDPHLHKSISVSIHDTPPPSPAIHPVTKKEDIPDLPPKAAHILKYTLWMVGRFHRCYVCQSRIARIVGCSREYVNRCLKKFHAEGLIFKMYRGVKRTCIYLSKLAEKTVPVPPCFAEMLSRQKQKVTQVFSQREKYKEDSSSTPKSKKLPYHLRCLSKLAEEERRKLAIFPEAIYKTALERLKEKTKKITFVLRCKKRPPIRIRSQFKMVFVACLREAKRRNYFLHRGWKEFYLWKEETSQGIII